MKCSNQMLQILLCLMYKKTHIGFFDLVYITFLYALFCHLKPSLPTLKNITGPLLYLSCSFIIMYVGGGDFEAHQHQVVEDLFE